MPDPTTHVDLNTTLSTAEHALSADGVFGQIQSTQSKALDGKRHQNLIIQLSWSSTGPSPVVAIGSEDQPDAH